MDPQLSCLFITYVEKEGPFLKVWGQADKNTSLYIEQVLHGFSHQFDNGLCIPHPETLQVGVLCCAKYKDNKYYRARITSLDYLHNRYIEVNFVDYGHKDAVPISNIRSLEGFDSNFISISPQAACFLLAEAVCPRGEWNDIYLDEICKEIRYREVTCNVVGQIARHFLVRLFIGANDLALILIAKGLMRHTSVQTQEAVLLSMPRTSTPQQGVPQLSIATYKAFTLEPGSRYEVYVSYVTDGPCNFSVQLKQSEEVLAKLMKEINSMSLTPMDGIPLPGAVCLARCVEDAHICRAVVTNEVDGQFKVFYVDFGNFEVVPLEAIYEIPFKFVIPKVMAIRFALAGVEKSTVTLEMQCAFKQFVDNRLIHMKVMPMTARSSLPRCELWDPETQITALDIVNQAASAGYPEHISLHRGFTQPVKVSYVFSCNRFYVQLNARYDELLKLMLDIQVLCRDDETLSNNQVKKGMPCYAMYQGDQQWYRSQIVDVVGGGKVKVHYVDYGNEEEVSISFLKPIEGRQLTILRPQAIECCLNGYQNMEPDLERDNLLEELILEQSFTMKVVEMQGKKALIELIDSNNYNVASLLLDKIATTKSQVSPMMVQAGNKIEHRKYSQPFNSREQRKPERGQKQWTESTNDGMGWRQEGRGSRNRSDSNENNENNDTNSWRQNNRGFSKNYDRNKRDNDLNESTDSEKHSNKTFGRNDRNSNNIDGGGSWKQNNRGFNKNQDRFKKDDNRNNDWAGGDDRTSPRSKSWGNRDNFQSKEDDDWGGKNNNASDKEESGGARQNDRQFHKRDQDNWSGGRDGGRKNFGSRSRDDDSRHFNKRDNWNNKESSREDAWGSGDNNREDNWGNKDGGRKGRDNFKTNRNRGDEGNDDWNASKPAQKGGFRQNRDEGNDDWGTSDSTHKGRFRKTRDEGNGDWGNTESTYKGGFRKKPDFKRETSELSSSGSEKSFRKGFKDNFHNKNKPNFNKKFDKPRDNFGDDSGRRGDSWNVSSSTAAEVPNPAPSAAEFGHLNVDNTESNVTISWFHNPTNFYCQLENTQDQFKQMMGDIQEAYKGRPPSTMPIGAPIIALFPEDKVLYRAKILELLGSQFKVYYVDFGNVSVVDKIWPIEQRFMDLPAQAICCQVNGIEPLENTWSDASTYSPYFDKNRFFCRFISTDGEKVAVQLECDDQDIATRLLQDGLAKSSLPAAPPELPLLIGQQFRAMLISLNSLADFSMCLQSGVLLNCGIFNVSESTETWEDTLKEKLEQILIVYVDDLKEDRLEVTLYDENGAKIKLIDKDEGAFETVDLLCPYLIMYSSLSGEVTHVDENTIFLQPSDCAQNIEYILNKCYEYYESVILENPIDPVESYVYAVRGSDTNWYRGRVTAIAENLVTVNYIDYGNSEDVEVNALRELTAEFMDVSIMCVPITVASADADLIGKIVTVDLTFTESGLEGSIREEAPPVVSAVESAVAAIEEQVDEVPQAAVESATPYGTEVILSHTDSPSDFYLQLAESADAVEQLQASLQEQIAEMTDMENPVVGALCAAPYSLDQQWYRAQVLDADADITTVRFVDYGNTDVLDNHTTRVKTLPPNLLALEVHATRCRLKIKPIDEEWTSAASERFDQLCNQDALTVQFISQDEKTNYVELFSKEINVREVLIQENLAQPDEDVLAETSSVGFVSHLNSPSEFWIQLENCVDELEWVAEQLSGAESFSELEDSAPGTLCAALFPDDQMWYRARILSNTVAGIEVLFVDYGNSCTSCSLRELPEDLVMLPPLAQKCSLQKPENLRNWGPEMARKFSEISADGQTTFNVKKLSTGETASVELLLDGVDVITLLLPKTEDVRVKSCEGLEEIILIKGEEELQEKYKLETLPDITWNDDSLKQFEEISNNGDTVFQAEFVSDNTIRLYIGLNDIRLDLNGTKTTTPTSSPLKIRRDSDAIHSTDAQENANNDSSVAVADSILNTVIDDACQDNSEIRQATREPTADFDETTITSVHTVPGSVETRQQDHNETDVPFILESPKLTDSEDKTTENENGNIQIPEIDSQLEPQEDYKIDSLHKNDDIKNQSESVSQKEQSQDIEKVTSTEACDRKMDAETVSESGTPNPPSSSENSDKVDATASETVHKSSEQESGSGDS